MTEKLSGRDYVRLNRAAREFSLPVGRLTIDKFGSIRPSAPFIYMDGTGYLPGLDSHITDETAAERWMLFQKSITTLLSPHTSFKHAGLSELHLPAMNAMLAALYIRYHFENVSIVLPHEIRFSVGEKSSVTLSSTDSTVTFDLWHPPYWEELIHQSSADGVSHFASFNLTLQGPDKSYSHRIPLNERVDDELLFVL